MPGGPHDRFQPLFNRRSAITGSSADVNVTKKLDYTLHARSQLRYTGNPAIGTGRNLEGSKATAY